MSTLRAMLEERRGTTSIEDWAWEINKNIQVSGGDRMKVSTLQAYLNGNRNITGKGAKLLARYFYLKNDLDMVNAISQLTLGIPYPISNGESNS